MKVMMMMMVMNDDDDDNDNDIGGVDDNWWWSTTTNVENHTQKDSTIFLPSSPSWFEGKHQIYNLKMNDRIYLDKWTNGYAKLFWNYIKNCIKEGKSNFDF